MSERIGGGYVIGPDLRRKDTSDFAVSSADHVQFCRLVKRKLRETLIVKKHVAYMYDSV